MYELLAIVIRLAFTALAFVSVLLVTAVTQAHGIHDRQTMAILFALSTFINLRLPLYSEPVPPRG